MKKLILIGLLLLPASAFAGGPKYQFDDPKLNDELQNIYYTIENPVIRYAQISSETVKYSNLSTSGALPYFLGVNTAGTSVTNPLVVSFATVLFDTGNGWNGNDTYTFPSAGQYAINCNLSIGVSQPAYAYINLFKNGSALFRGTIYSFSSAGFSGPEFHGVFNFSKGDTLYIQLAPASATGSLRTSNSPYENYLSIQKLSN